MAEKRGYFIIWNKAVAFLFALPLLIILCSSFSSAYFYTTEAHCKERICIIGETMNWTVTLKNMGAREIGITAVEIVDIKNDVEIASYVIEYDPARSDRRDYISINPSSERKITFSSRVPRPNSGQQTFFSTCITTLVDPQSAFYIETYQKRTCYRNESINVYECTRDSHCRETQKCSGFKCADIVCEEECTYAKGHKCVRHECCSNEECAYDEACISNKCTKLECNYNEYAFNHTCVELECRFDEKIVNQTCVKLNCSYDEGFINHTCVKLECRENEYITDHRCARLNCNYDEYAFNHTCVKLNCSDGEVPQNHRCVRITCRFFEERIGNECVLDHIFIYAVLVESVLILTIVFLIVINIRKIRAVKKEKELDRYNHKSRKGGATKGEKNNLQEEEITDSDSSKEEEINNNQEEKKSKAKEKPENKDIQKKEKGAKEKPEEKEQDKDKGKNENAE